MSEAGNIVRAAGAYAGNALLSAVRVALAGSDVGLGPGDFEAWAATQPTTKLLEVRGRMLKLAAQLAEESEAAHAKAAAEDRERVAEALDRGAAPPDSLPLERQGPLMVYMGRLEALRAEFGGEHPLYAARDRAKLCGRLLFEHYRDEGEPRGARELRKRISTATAEAWEADGAMHAARKTYRERGCARGGASEADVLRAVDASTAAHAKVAALRRELFEAFGL